MLSPFSWRRLPGLFAGLAFAFLLPQALPAADKDKDDKKDKPEKVQFQTFDKVKIHGSFYAPQGGGRKAPAVLILHELGGKSSDGGWDELARNLKNEGFAVLTFDFRGHGKSTTVDKDFWQYPGNQGLKGFNPGNPRAEINYADFPQSYFPVLVNDIEAAKRFLDEQNDAGLCNSSSLILIGAKDGAALGTLWAAWGFQNPRLGGPAFRPVIKGVEGEDISCCVWLSISTHVPAPGAVKNIMGARMPLNQWVQTRNRFAQNETLRDKVPMYLISGPAGKTTCNWLLSSLKGGKAKITQFDYIKTLTAANKLEGRDLLGKTQLDTENYIVKYIQKINDEGDKGWKMKNVGMLPLQPVNLRLFGL